VYAYTSNPNYVGARDSFSPSRAPMTFAIAEVMERKRRRKKRAFNFRSENKDTTISF